VLFFPAMKPEEKGTTEESDEAGGPKETAS